MGLANRRQALFVIVLVIVSSFVSSMAVFGKKTAFFLPHNRMWELASGALLAAAILGRENNFVLSPRLQSWTRKLNSYHPAEFASYTGAGLIALSFFGLNKTLTYPGGWALLPCAGALLIIGAGKNAKVNLELLSRPVLVFIGLISYPLYLWHWPLLSFAAITGYGANLKIRFTAVSLALVLSILTYWYIERPLRHRRSNAVPIVLLSSTLAFCAIGFLAQKDVLTARLNTQQYRDISDAINDWHYPDGLQRTTTETGLTLRTAGPNADTVLFAGDSNMEQYWPRIQTLLGPAGANRSVVFATKGGCPPVPGLRLRSGDKCTLFGDHVAAFAASPNIHSAVFAAVWSQYAVSSEYSMDGSASAQPRDEAKTWDAMITSLCKMIGELRVQGKTVWLVLTIPNGPGLSPMSGLHRSLTAVDRIYPTGLDRAAFEKTWAPARAKLITSALAAGAKIIDPMNWLCDAKACPGQTVDGKLMYKDGSHLRARYVREHATFMDQTLSGGGISTRR